MAQATDIVLNSAGYMISPGSTSSPGYRKLQDGYPEGLTQRTTFTDFFGGQRRTHQLERDQFYDSLRIRPALGGQGVVPWGEATTRNNNPVNDSAMPDRDVRIPHVIVRDELYFAVGKSLYRGPGTNGTGAHANTLLKTYDHDITDLTIYGSNALLIAFGSAADLLFRQTITNAEVALFPGERAHRIEAYAGFAVWIDARTASTPTVIRMVTGTDIQFRHVNHDAFAMAPVDGHILLITKQALYTFAGRVADVLVPNPGWTADGTGGSASMPGEEWTGEFEPFFQNGVYTEPDDFKFVTGYGGKTLAWISGGVHELTPSGDRAGWTSTGLHGLQCFGGTVAAGYAIVSIESHAGKNELWAYDGNGWWCIDRQEMTEPTWCWPTSLGSTSSGWNLQVYLHGVEFVRFYRLRPQPNSATSLGFAESAEFVSPLIDASDRDKIKAWRKIGAVFSSPELNGNIGSTDPVVCRLDYSIDAGVTWVEGHPSQNTRTDFLQEQSLANMNFSLETELTNATSRYIILRVVWISVTDWSPILTGIWVEHEALSSPARRRKWTLRIHARDQEIDRDGVVLTRTGRELIEELWQAWETDTLLPFRDIDYDDDPTTYTVRIVGIQELVAQPADSNNWGDSLITLNLVEV